MEEEGRKPERGGDGEEMGGGRRMGERERGEGMGSNSNGMELNSSKDFVQAT